MPLFKPKPSKDFAPWNPGARPLPRHIAIIMDGNGRWARRRALPREMGHRAGVDAMREVIRETGRLGVEALTFYAFSTENWSRSKEEVGTLMALLLECFQKEMDELDARGVCVRGVGDIDGLPGPQRDALRAAEARTANNQGLKLGLALNYGGRAELVQAARALAAEAASGALDPAAIDEAAFASRLTTAGLPDVDLLIRTSGEQRLSNFLLYQSAYAELVFTQVFWPDFSLEEYHRALEIYFGRRRRFGGRPEDGSSA
jgi:undecaprenyl diphosphate synthase